MEVTAAILLGLVNRLVEGFKAILSGWSLTANLDPQTRTIVIVVFAGAVGALLSVLGQYDPLAAVATLSTFPAWLREAAVGIAISAGSGGVQWVLDLIKALTNVQVAKAESLKSETDVNKSYTVGQAAVGTLQPASASITEDFVAVVAKAVADEVMRRLDDEDKLVPDAPAA